MALINSVLSWLMKKRIHQIELFRMYPHEVQEEVFKDLILKAKNTEWGKLYNYASIKSVDEYKQRVPISDYKALQPYIDRLIKGEQNILWGSDIKWFAKSSGTTSSKSKFIPISKESLEECHYKGGKDMLAIYCDNNPESLLFDGKSLSIGGSQNFFSVNNDAFYGDLSAIIMQNLPFWAEFIRTPDISIALMDEWESKINKIAEVTVKENVTNIIGVPSWTLLVLKRILEKSGKKDLSEVWNNLETYIHGGINFKPYKEQFKKIIPGNNVKYIETYNASEGFFGIQDTNDSEDMLLMLDYGIYYEFIPLDKIHDSQPQTLSLSEIEMNKNYALVISTNGGLWRYLIGDIVKFTSINPYKIQITGRTKSFINAFGEELIIDNAENALAIALEKSNALINEFTVAPVFYEDHHSGAHQWLIEFIKYPENIDYFTEVLDNALKSLNSDYEAKRYKNILLKKPVIITLPENSFYNWLKSKGKLGGQHKVPRLSNDRTFADDLLNKL